MMHEPGWAALRLEESWPAADPGLLGRDHLRLHTQHIHTHGTSEVTKQGIQHIHTHGTSEGD